MRKENMKEKIKNFNRINSICDIKETITFYNETNFGDLTDFWVLDFSTTGQYDVIYNHILIHKYYINMDKKEEIPMDEAVISWFNNVYLPVIHAIETHHILKHFKGRTRSDLYVFVIKYWDELKQKFGESFSLDQAAEDFKYTYGKKTLLIRIKNLFAKKKMQQKL